MTFTDVITHKSHVLNTKSRPRTIIETPFAGDFKTNRDYLGLCTIDALEKGKAPAFAHQQYTQILNDHCPIERKQGIDASFEFHACAESKIYYVDRGMNIGMIEGYMHAIKNGITVEFCSLLPRTPTWVKALNETHLKRPLSLTEFSMVIPNHIPNSNQNENLSIRFGHLEDSINHLRQSTELWNIDSQTKLSVADAMKTNTGVLHLQSMLAFAAEFSPHAVKETESTWRRVATDTIIYLDGMNPNLIQRHVSASVNESVEFRSTKVDVSQLLNKYSLKEICDYLERQQTFNAEKSFNM
ncbi:hypothetical protein AB6D11_19170 [Vibrio splendidus]